MADKHYSLPKKVFFLKEIRPKKILNFSFPVYLSSDIRSYMRTCADEDVTEVINAAHNFFAKHPDKSEWVEGEYQFFHFERQHNRKRLSVLFVTRSHNRVEVRNHYFLNPVRKIHESLGPRLILSCYGIPIAMPEVETWEKVNHYFKHHPERARCVVKVNGISKVFLHFNDGRQLPRIIVLGSVRRDFKGRVGSGNYKWVNFALDQQGSIYVVDICGSRSKRVVENFDRDSRLMERFHGPIICTTYAAKDIKKQYRLVNYLGIPLKQCRRINFLTNKQILEVSNKLLLVLRDLHQTHHLVHRDVKPENVLYNPDSTDASVTLIDYNFIEKIGSRVIDCGSDVYRCAQSKKEKSSPFMDLFAFKRLLHQQKGCHYLYRRTWSVRVIFSADKLADAVKLITQKDYTHGVILHYEVSDNGHWYYYLFCDGGVKSDSALEITEGNASNLYSFLQSVENKKSLNDDKRLLSLLKEKLTAAQAIPSAYTNDQIKIVPVENYRIVSRSLMSAEYVKQVGLKSVMDRIEELGAPETAIDTSHKRYYANPDRLLPFDAVLVCFILAELFPDRSKSQLNAEIFLQNSNRSWNYQFFIERRDISNQIIMLYKSGCREKLRYQSSTFSNTLFK